MLAYVKQTNLVLGSFNYSNLSKLIVHKIRFNELNNFYLNLMSIYFKF